MKRYKILGEFKFKAMTFYPTFTVIALNLTDAIKEAKDKVIKDFGSESITLLDFKPDPLMSGIVI